MVHMPILRHLDRAEWEAEARTFWDLSYRQCWAYANAAARDVGARAEFVGVYDGDRLIGLANVRVKSVPILRLGMAYVNHGPLTRDGAGFAPDRFRTCLRALEQHYVKRRKLLLRIAPPSSGGLALTDQAEAIGALGFRAAEGVKPLESFVVDLERDLPALRRSFDKKWTASLTRAEKLGVTVTRTQDPADFQQFEELYRGLVERKGFYARQGASFFSAVSREARAVDRLELHLAWHEGDLVAGHVGSFVGDTAVMILAAANPQGRDLCASFALQWAVVQRAKSLGQLYYDLGGIDQVANPDVYRFKKRMNGRHVVAQSYELAPSPARKAAMDLLETMWGQVRALRRGRTARPA